MPRVVKDKSTNATLGFEAKLWLTADKLAIARRLRRETTLTLQQIATGLHIGSRVYLRNCLQGPAEMTTKRKP